VSRERWLLSKEVEPFQCESDNLVDPELSPAGDTSNTTDNMAAAVVAGVKRVAGFREPVIGLLSGSCRAGSVNVKLAHAAG
jgi:hypothetical protein